MNFMNPTDHHGYDISVPYNLDPSLCQGRGPGGKGPDEDPKKDRNIEIM